MATDSPRTETFAVELVRHPETEHLVELFTVEVNGVVCAYQAPRAIARRHLLLWLGLSEDE